MAHYTLDYAMEYDISEPVVVMHNIKYINS